MRTEDWRAVWLGAAIAVVATLLLTVLAASLESTVNGPGRRNVAEPVLWAFGGGFGLALGAVITGWITKRIGAGALAALIGAVPLLVLVIVAYNSTDLRFEDQLVGTLVIVVVPAYVTAVVCGAIAAVAARLLGGRQASAVSRNSPTS
ncbi:MAG: hypothetical protein WD271_07020 [Acidimicrobiia bacterium]